MSERESGRFAEQNDGQHQGTQDTAAWYRPHVLDFNWAHTQDELQTTQYRYLADTVFENYSMHLEARRQSSMDRAQFLTCLRLLYTNMPADTEELDTFPGSAPGQDPNNTNPVKQGSPSSQESYQAPHDTSKHGVDVKQEEGVEQYVETGTFSMQNAALDPTAHHMDVNLKAGTHAPSSGVLVGTTERVDETEQDRTVLSRDDKYQEKKEELQRLVSTVLYLTEMYGVAQTRGGAQVSQYRRTLTAQSHTLLVQRLARELQQTEAGFWTWLDRGTTPPAQM